MVIHTLRDVAAKYFEENDLTKKTEISYRTCIRRLEKAIGCVPISEYNDDWLHRLKDSCKDLKPATVNQTLLSVRVLLNYCREEGLIKSVPRIRRVRVRQSVPQMPTLEDLGAAYRHVHVANWPLENAELFWRTHLVTAYFTAFRMADLLYHLRWESIQNTTLHHVAEKTGKLHVMPIHPVLMQHLELAKGLRIDGDDRITPVKRCEKQYRREFHAICEAAGVRHFGAQEIRRLSATMYSRAHVGAGGLILGHSLRHTAFYVAVPDVLEIAVEKLEFPPEFKDPC